MTRENKTQLRMALDENVQESYEELDDNIGEFAECLFDGGLEREEVIGIATKVRQSYIKQIIQLYSN
jgi:hypothetical protein